MEVGDLCNDYVKLEIDDEYVKAIVETHWGLREGEVEKLKGFDDLNYRLLPRKSCNVHVPTLWPHGYILKITNHLDSKNTDISEAQIDLMNFLSENKISTTIPIKMMNGRYYTKVKISSKTAGSNEREHIVRLFQFLPGVILTDVPLSYPLLFKLGKFSASVTYTMKRFTHQAFKSHSSIWHLRNAPNVIKYLNIVDKAERRKLISTVMDEFVQYVLSKEESLEKGVIHGDINENNIVMLQTEEGVWDIAGILDLGDSHFSYCLFDFAIAQCYMMLECKKQNLDPMVGAGHFLAGYVISRPSAALDYGLLKISICARLCQSLVLGLKAHSLNPENTYVLSSQTNGWAVLEQVWHTSNEEITRIWNSVTHLYGLNINTSSG